MTTPLQTEMLNRIGNMMREEASSMTAWAFADHFMLTQADKGTCTSLINAGLIEYDEATNPRESMLRLTAAGLETFLAQ